MMIQAIRFSILPSILVATALLTQQATVAWDIDIGTNSDIDNVIYVDSAIGAFTWETTGEGVFAGAGIGSIPSTLTQQFWDPVTGTWPAGMIAQEVLGAGIEANAEMAHFGGNLPDSRDDSLSGDTTVVYRCVLWQGTFLLPRPSDGEVNRPSRLL